MPTNEHCAPSNGLPDVVAEEYAQGVRRRLGTQVREIRLFGSRARGQARPHSDYDMLVVLEVRTVEAREAILDIAVRLMDRYGVLVATVLRSADEWRDSQGFPLARNVLREGTLL